GREGGGRLSGLRVLRRLRRLLDGGRVELRTDQKALYGSLCRRLFPGQVTHTTVSGRLPRTSFNPLFPINLTDAMLRDNNGRMRRRSWLVSKRRRMLGLQLELFTADRNWHPPRTSQDPPEPRT